MIFWKFEIFEKRPGPIVQKPAKKWCFEKGRFYFFKNPQKNGVWKNPDFWAIPRGPNPGFPDAAAGGAAGAGAGAAGRILKSRSRPFPTHPGMKYFRKETLAVDKQIKTSGCWTYWDPCDQDFRILDLPQLAGRGCWEHGRTCTCPSYEHAIDKHVMLWIYVQSIQTYLHHDTLWMSRSWYTIVGPR